MHAARDTDFYTDFFKIITMQKKSPIIINTARKDLLSETTNLFLLSAWIRFIYGLYDIKTYTFCYISAIHVEAIDRNQPCKHPMLPAHVDSSGSPKTGPEHHKKLEQST